MHQVDEINSKMKFILNVKNLFQSNINRDKEVKLTGNYLGSILLHDLTFHCDINFDIYNQ